MKKKWYQSGSAPDYRFSLANERTFLAWIRTALSLLAGALAIDQFVDDGLGSNLLRSFLAVSLSLCAGLLGLYAYRRWAQNEKAMRNKEDLQYTPFLFFVSIITLFIAVFLALLVIF